MSQPLFKDIAIMPNLVPSYFEDKRWSMITNFIWAGILLILLAFCALVGSGLTNGIFLSVRNLSNLLGSQMLYFIIGLPIAAVLFSRGGIDLSIGALAALSGMVFVVLFAQNGGLVAGLTSMFLCLVFGIVNASLVGFLRIPGILVTFIMAALMRGITLVLSDGQTMMAAPGGELAVFLWVLVVLIFAGAILITRVRQPEGAGYLKRTLSYGWPFLAMALCSGLMGIAFVERLHAATINAGMGIEIKILGAVILGGTWFNGRRPNFIGLVLGAIIMTSIDNVFSLVGVSNIASAILISVLIIVVLGLQVGFHAIVGYLYKNNAGPKIS